MVEVKSCGIFVWRKTPVKSFLLMQHTSRLDIPKGHVDSGETELQCAIRELWEETAIQQQNLQIDPGFCYRLQYMVKKDRYGNVPRLKELVVFLAELIEPVSIKLTEHIGYEWMPWNPPHKIQEQTIDPLLSAVEAYWDQSTER